MVQIHKTTLPLSNNERFKLVNAILAARRKNPQLSWKSLFDLGRKALTVGRISKHIDHPNKLPWIKPMLGIEDTTKKQKIKNGQVQPALMADMSLPKKKIDLNDQEKLTFVKAFVEFRKANPERGNLGAIQAANATMPEHRKISAAIDSIKQISWIIPLIEQIENPPKVESKMDSRWACKLTDKQKEQFAEIVYRLRKGGAIWTRCMREANTFMPEGHKIAASVVNPSGVPWLQRALVKLEEADKDRVVIDHRGTLPKAETSEPEYHKERKHSETKTHWNEEDKSFFSEVAYQLKICNPGWGWQRILDEANREMPGHKQRPKMPPSPSQMPWLNPMLDKIAKRPPERHEPEPVKIPEIAMPAPAPAPSMDMQAMMMAAFEKVAREHIAGGMNMAVTTPQLARIEPPARKKIIVVGLLPVQTNDIQKRFGHKFDFKFIGSNTPNQQIRDCMKNADIGILMTRFVSHPTQAAMRDHPGFTFCNGNSTALENLLEEKFSKLDGQ